jgi:Protein of unknown function (DUF1552)
MQPITRRTMLKGVGTAIALPWLESVAGAANPTKPSLAEGPPKRAAFLYVPNGVEQSGWNVNLQSSGPIRELKGLLAPLNPHKDYVTVLSHLTLDKARANGDGPGDHARAMSTFLTGRQPRKTAGADIRIGISADQHIANAIGDLTRLPSLELGIERGQMAGGCDSGYSCAYSSNLSWRSETTPNAKEVDPKLVFERLFGGNDPKELAATRAKKQLFNKSILDFVAEDTKNLSKRLGQGDQRKLDEYLTAVREVEEQIDRIAKLNATRKPVERPNMTLPASVPQDFQEHVRLMCDLLVLSFQTDLTRVVTLPIANDGSGRSYRSIGVSEGHHDLSHHGRNQAKLEKIAKINSHHLEQFAYLVNKLSKVKEANGTSLLDNTMMVYGSGIGDGDRHNHDELPILLVGGGGGTLKGGRHIEAPRETPLMNLYLAMFERLGCPTARFGDSTGVLSI